MKNKTRNPDAAFSASQRFFVGLAALMLMATGVPAQNISTVVSNGLFEPNSVAIDSVGNAYITVSANNFIAKFEPSAGTLTSLAGLPGFSGSSSGTNTQARFAQPSGLVAARGGLVVVDQGNQAIRFVGFDGVVSPSPIAGVIGQAGSSDTGAGTFRYPAGIAADAAGNLYVADQGNNLIRKIDTHNVVTTITNSSGYSFLQPTGIAIDGNSNIWVADTGNQVIVMISNGTATVIAGSPGVSGYADSYGGFPAEFSLPTGLLWDASSNTLLVADTGNNVIRTVSLQNVYGNPTYLVETLAGLPFIPGGNVDGALDVATFSSPVGLSLDPFDSGYYIVDRNGIGSTEPGGLAQGALRVFQSQAPLPPPNPPEFGYVVFQQSSPGLPATTVFNSTSNAIFNNAAIIAYEPQANTETFLTEAPFGQTNPPLPGTNSGFSPQQYLGDGQTTAAPTIIEPAPDVVIYGVSEGPTGKLSALASARFQWVVANPIITGNNAASLTLTDETLGAAMYYTVDSNTPVIGASDTFGPYYSGATITLSITNDTLLSVRAFTNTYQPSGLAVQTLIISNYVPSTINFSPVTKLAGPGSTLAVPIYANLSSSSGLLESYQFRAEVEALNDDPASAVAPLTALSFSISNYIPLTGNASGSTFYYDPIPLNYTTNFGSQGLIVYTYTNSGLDLTGSGTVALVEIPIPNDATNGLQYSLTIIDPSGTSDGNQTNVPLVGVTNFVMITNVIYMAGDTSPAVGYNASEFGDGQLNNADVNNAMYASVGIRQPFAFTDAYNAMDVYPPDNGDGVIGQLDWETILNRAVGLDTNNWIRYRTNGGVLMHVPIMWTPSGANYPISNYKPLGNAEPRRPLDKDSSGPTPPGLVWFTQAHVGADTQTHAVPGTVCSIPVYVTVGAGFSLSGTQFRAILSSVSNAPAPGAIKFAPASGVPQPVVLPGLSPNDIACFWPVGNLTNVLHGKTYLGNISFTVPSNAQSGQSYALHFVGVDGAPDMQTLYKLESFPASVWVLSAALQPDQITSDEWRTAFFGSPSSSQAGDYVDADGDGMLNWQEYLAGTNPTNALSKLQLITASSAQGVAFSWLTAPGKTYTLQSSASLSGGSWTPVNTNVGDGNNYQFVLPSTAATALFYQLRVNQ